MGSDARREILADALIDLALRALPRETDELNVQEILRDLSLVYWRFTPEQARAALAPRVERVLRAGLAAARTRSLKGSYFSTLRASRSHADARVADRRVEAAGTRHRD